MLRPFGGPALKGTHGPSTPFFEDQISMLSNPCDEDIPLAALQLLGAGSGAIPIENISNVPSGAMIGSTL